VSGFFSRSRSGRIRPATTRGSSPRQSPAGFAAWPTGACRPGTDLASISPMSAGRGTPDVAESDGFGSQISGEAR
jgi:hypothetical protein